MEERLKPRHLCLTRMGHTDTLRSPRTGVFVQTFLAVTPTLTPYRGRFFCRLYFSIPCTVSKPVVFAQEGAKVEAASRRFPPQAKRRDAASTLPYPGVAPREELLPGRVFQKTSPLKYPYPPPSRGRKKTDRHRRWYTFCSPGEPRLLLLRCGIW